MSKVELPYPLTAEQLAIATAPPDLPQLILAPPGTGKTHTVIARIWHLIEQCGLHPRQDLLVLCFTRAAVREIMDRVTQLIHDQRVHDDLRFVSVRTFDSFATSLLLHNDPGRNLNDLGYDARIELITQAFQDENSPERKSISEVRHLIVDEIQDLVGVRAELVRCLINCISGRFTLLGDPAQAIYDFAAQGRPNSLRIDGLLKWLASQPWFSNANQFELTQNHRASGPVTQISAAVRHQLLTTGTDDELALRRLRGMIMSLASSGSTEEPGPALTGSHNGTVCIVCRSNGEVLQIISMLARQGIHFNIRPRPEDNGLPAWIGRLLATTSASRLTRRDVEGLWAERITRPDQPDVDQAWNWLKRLEGREQSDLNIHALVQQLRIGQRLPDEADAFLDSDVSGVALSTIHAVKGREFDHVIVLGPDDILPSEHMRALEEARVLYVAATRARQELTRLDRTGLPKMWKIKLSGGRSRWIAREADSHSWFMEVGLPGDVEYGSGVNTYIYPTQKVACIAQDYLWEIIRPGAEVTLRKVTRGNYVFYYIEHITVGQRDAVVLGQMSKPFKEDIAAVLGKYSNQSQVYPDLLKATVAAVVTQILDAFPEHIYDPFATAQLCLEVRLRGMGFLMKE